MTGEKRKNKKRVFIVQLIVAILFTVVSIGTLPVLAWFNHQRQVAELQRIKAPDLLYVSAACAEDVKYFDMSRINIGSDESNDPEMQLFSFAVTGEYVSAFTLQFAHTTNNPFTYKIYEGEILCKNGDGAVCKSKAEAQEEIARRNTAAGTEVIHFDSDVVEYEAKATWEKIAGLNRKTVYHIDTGDMIYILKSTCLKTGVASEYLNARVVNGRIVANGRYHEETYHTYDTVNQFAEPLYWQSSDIRSVNSSSGWGAKPFFKPFILEVSWDRDKISNKETDMIYLSVYRKE